MPDSKPEWDQETYRLAIQAETEQSSNRWVGVSVSVIVPSVIIPVLLFLHSCAVSPGAEERTARACVSAGSSWMPVLSAETSEVRIGQFETRLSKEQSCVPRDQTPAVLAQNALLIRSQAEEKK